MNRLVETFLPTKWGNFRMLAYANANAEMPHLALVSQNFDNQLTPIVRLHSECLTGDLLGSLRCDCGEQLAKSLETINEKGGVLIYLRQEGRGIGLINKMKAYNLQDKGLNTFDANLHLGFEADARSYDIAIQILKDLEIKRLHLMTNNPEKLHAFDKSDIQILSRIPVIVPPKKENLGYLTVKQDLMGHLLNL
ncbi:MAG: GTP cyclohydrolase II [Chitinophagales bacterium]